MKEKQQSPYARVHHFTRCLLFLSFYVWYSRASRVHVLFANAIPSALFAVATRANERARSRIAIAIAIEINSPTFAIRR